MTRKPNFANVFSAGWLTRLCNHTSLHILVYY